MIEFLKNITIRKYWPLKLWWDRKESYLLSTGWIRSFNEKKPVNQKGEPIAWLSLPMVALLEERLAADMRVFEYGAGNSTFFFAKRVKSVTSVEHDEGWVSFLKSKLPTNASLRVEKLEDGEKYPDAVLNENSSFHLVLIDGRERVKCAYRAVKSLTDDGVIVFDDTNRKKYLEAMDMLKEKGFRRLDFWGLGPGSIFLKCTSIFYKPGNCFGI